MLREKQNRGNQLYGVLPYQGFNLFVEPFQKRHHQVELQRIYYQR